MQPKWIHLSSNKLMHTLMKQLYLLTTTGNMSEIIKVTMKINVNDTLNKALFKFILTMMYLQAVNPHPTAISTQLCQFCSWPPCPPSPVSAVHHLPHCCSQTESDHGWERDIEAIIAWLHREDDEDMTPLNHTILNKSRRTCAGQSGSCCVCSKNVCAALHEHHYL